MSIERLYNRIKHAEPFQILAERIAQGDQEVTVRGLPGSLLGFALAYLSETVPQPLAVVCATDDRAEALRDDLERILGGKEVGYFPAWDVTPSDGRSPHLDVVGLRMESLSLLGRSASTVAVAPVAALMGHTLSPELFALSSDEVRIGQERAPGELAEHLVEIGYERVPTVEGVGQFSVRGGIMDLCSFGNPHPVRVEFWGDEVTSLRGFDLGTQRSVAEVESVCVLPCRELVLPDTLSSTYAENLARFEEEKGLDLSSVHEALEGGGMLDGLEHYIGILYGDRTGFLDHMPESTIVVLDDPPAVEAAAEEAWEKAVQTTERTRKGKRAGGVANLPTETFARGPDGVLSRLHASRRILVQVLGERGGETIDFGGTSGRKYEGHLSVFKEDLHRYWRENYEVVVLCESQGQRARLEELLSDSVDTASIYVGTLHGGFSFAPGRALVVNDHEIYSRHHRRRRYRRFQGASPIRSVSALRSGDFVVHVDHGIGRYAGIERLSVDGIGRDCLALLYRGGDRVLVPVDQMDRVQKYSSDEGAAPVLSKLGSAAWERLKAKTRKEIFKMAAELVSLYAVRKAREGTAFSEDTPMQKALEASFPFQETRDQLKAIEDVRGDMEQASPMDRLICGDVGYGKTEVAIRAAFKAVADSKQVAVLAPTTILAQQHFRTFQDRMDDLPVRVAVLSRFCTRAEQMKVVSQLKSGGVDVVIGTHRMLSKDVTFRDLGLLVIDEEHRFGVRQKERLKQMKRLVDVLTLTATPIPRTLHMSLMGARDMSIIETPPKDRLPIYTEVVPFGEEKIAEAVLREIDRGGQVYFVHNRIQSMPAMLAFLEELVPQVRFAAAHGQMPERQLEKIMMDFLDRKYDCLVSTMIIESGLDIPSVNTLIVNRADRLGLAQLYQLRGRVGRSSQRAYAHLLIPSRKALRRPAVRRLRAIEEFSDLGSGFHISMRDMEIRGAGNLLGAQQHGHITAVGFDLYCRLLDEAIQQLKGEQTEALPEPEVQISVSAYIPDEFVPDGDQKMAFYQRLGEARQTVEVLAIEEELQDRFGQLPGPALALLDTIQVKILARQLRLGTLRIGLSLSMGFRPEHVMQRTDVERMVEKSPLPLQFYLGDAPRVEAELDGGGPRERLSSAKKVLQCLV